MRAGVWLLAAAVAVMGWRVPPAKGDFVIVSQSARVDVLRRQVDFHLVFNQKPDFFGTDSLGRPNNAFQYWYNPTATNCDELMGASTEVIRGPEIRFDDKIPIRQSVSSPNGPARAEGWGPILGEVGFQTSGMDVSFSVPWSLLHETDKRFCYSVIGLQNGSMTSDFAAVVIPLPPGVWVGAAGLGIAFVYTALRGRQWVSG